MTDAEAKVRLLKIVYGFEAAGLSFVSGLERQLSPAQNHKSPGGSLHPGFVSPLRDFKKSK